MKTTTIVMAIGPEESSDDYAMGTRELIDTLEVELWDYLQTLEGSNFVVTFTIADDDEASVKEQVARWGNSFCFTRHQIDGAKLMCLNNLRSFIEMAKENETLEEFSLLNRDDQFEQVMQYADAMSGYEAIQDCMYEALAEEFGAVAEDGE